MKILNIILLNKDVYKKLTDKKSGIYAGIILVGILNMAILLIDKFQHLFYGKSFAILFYNITLALLYSVLAGFAYILFFTFPLFDMFKFFKRERNLEPGAFLTRFVKVYIIVSFLTLPANILLYAITHKLSYQAYSSFDDMGFYILILTIVWFSAAITRGLDAICGYLPVFKRIVFVSVLTWNFLIVYVLGYISDRWAFLLFK